MGHIAGCFDPLTFVGLHRQVTDMMSTLSARGTPASCPTDPSAKQDHLRALALIALMNGHGRAAGRPEAIVVIDATAADTDGRPAVDWGLPVEVPWRVLTELVAEADIHTVVVRHGVVVHAPGALNLGRSTRIANRAQRRVLRALYPSCAIPGCGVGYEHCDLHHVMWWRHGGTTDLSNLVPVCDRHHHDIHDNGWRLALSENRTLAIAMPDGQQMTTGPPKRNAA